MVKYRSTRVTIPSGLSTKWLKWFLEAQDRLSIAVLSHTGRRIFHHHYWLGQRASNGGPFTTEEVEDTKAYCYESLCTTHYFSGNIVHLSSHGNQWSLCSLCNLQYKFCNHPLSDSTEQSEAHSLEHVWEVPLAVAAVTSQSDISVYMPVTIVSKEIKGLAY